METMCFKKENEVVTKIDLTEEEIENLRSYGRHLCFGCKNGNPITCAKIRDYWEETVLAKYPFIEEGIQVYCMDEDQGEYVNEMLVVKKCSLHEFSDEQRQLFEYNNGIKRRGRGKVLKKINS